MGSDPKRNIVKFTLAVVDTLYTGYSSLGRTLFLLSKLISHLSYTCPLLGLVLSYRILPILKVLRAFKGP
jgi:hypothetical protein